MAVSSVSLSSFKESDDVAMAAVCVVCEGFPKENGEVVEGSSAGNGTTEAGFS